ncbi:MAG: polysaccharide biosynthesis tyrosine autokinase [Prevotella sp.]|nr:polysaccharide biosynthesis tyrosine autokinase [Prevotella sp.]
METTIPTAINKENSNTHDTQANVNMTIKDFLLACLFRWKWFVLSVIIALILAGLYLAKKQPIYTRSAEVLIKNTKGGGGSLSSELSGLSEMGIFSASSSVSNELIVMKSPALLMEVVRRMNLDVNYTVPGYRDYTLYGDRNPIKITFANLKDDDFVSFDVKIKKDGTFEMDGFSKNGYDLEGSVSGKLNTTMKTPVGRLYISTTPAYAKLKGDLDINIVRTSILSATQICKSKFDAFFTSKTASVITLKYEDVSMQRAEDILNMIIKVYQEGWMNDKNQIALSTSRFITERLSVIEKELGNVDSDISSYKSRNLVPDVSEAAKMYMTNANQANNELLNLNNQLYMLTFIREQLMDNTKKNQLLPSGMLSHNAGLESQISKFNELQMQRNNLASSSSEGNPLVKDLDQQLATLRTAVSGSLNNTINQVRIQINGMQAKANQNTAQIASSPIQAKQLLSVERQQKVKEALYIYLLQKREENQLSQAFTAYNTRIVTPPMGSRRPTAPVRRNIWLVALLLGLAIPAAIVYIVESLDTKIRGKKDIENVSIPFIGEIPLYGDKKKRLEAEGKILVQAKKRNMINEAFRVVRTNVEFMSNSYDNAKVFMVTSINPGSGKTFVTINLASSFALKDKKVIVLDLDIRKGSVGRYLNVGTKTRGVANYLSGQETDWKKMIVNSADCPQLDILPCGTIPPNPAELLSNGRLEELIADLREQYDYIFLDSAPVDIVADTAIIADQADMTIFVIRTGLLSKEMIPTIEGYYTDKKLKNMGLVLNGSEIATGRYGYHRHGYGYGYGYGKGYGSYTHEEE